jgi:hypothetical protein
MLRALYLTSLVSLTAALWLGLEAWDGFEAASAAQASLQGLTEQVAALEREINTAQALDPWPLKYSPDAMSEFFSRTVEAGEVLGAGVRVEARDTLQFAARISFSDLRPGIQVSRVTLQAAMEGEHAPAILAMFEEELASLPASVRKIAARRVARDVAVTFDVDVFGRTP